MTSLPPPVQSVLELFQGPLSSLRFADIDGAGLTELAAAVEAAASEVREQETKLGELRQTLAQRQDALLALAQQALAYARVYAENDEALLDAVNRISLPRATKPRKASASKGSGARDAASETASGATGAETDTALEAAAPEADSTSGSDESASAEAEPVARAPQGPSARGPRKGRAAASPRAAN